MVHAMMPTSYIYKRTRFWPEGGMIWVEDMDTGAAEALTRKQALLRAKAINDTINFYPHASERNEQQKLVEELIECVRRAKDQGDPTDPEVRKQKVTEIQRTRKAKVLMAPGFRMDANAKPLNLPGLRNLDFTK